MGRKPTKNLNLPQGMRARPKAGGKIYYYLDTGGRPRKEIPLGSDYIAAVQKWAELTVNQAAPAHTFKDVCDRYVREVLPTKAPRTREDNSIELQMLLKFFNDPPVALNDIEPQHVKQYLKWRVDSAKEAARERNAQRKADGKAPLAIDHRLGHVRANREKALLSHIWNFARGAGITTLPNPCRGIKGYTEDGRDEYVEDEVYQAVYDASPQRIKDALDLAFLTGQRPADVLKMSVTDLKDDLLRVRQGKTKTPLRMRTRLEDGTPNELGHLLERIAQGKKSHKLTDIALICGADGMRMTASALDNAFDRAREAAIKKALAAGNRSTAAAIKTFQFRDLRAKAGTEKADEHGLMEAQRQLGHASVTMTEAYVRLGQIVTPTR